MGGRQLFLPKDMGGSALSWKLWGSCALPEFGKASYAAVQALLELLVLGPTCSNFPKCLMCTRKTGDGMLQCSHSILGSSILHVIPSTVLPFTGTLEAPIGKAPYSKAAESVEKPSEQQPPLCSLFFLPTWRSHWQGVRALSWCCVVRDCREGIF